jgi:hypothetical protein
MAARSRNAPCACGSGKKVKHCCGSRASVVAQAPAAALHRMDERLRSEERFVHEVKGSRTVRFREALLARVVDHEGLSVFCGVYPRSLPPREADRVVRAVRGELKVRGRGAGLMRGGGHPC